MKVNWLINISLQKAVIYFLILVIIFVLTLTIIF